MVSSILPLILTGVCVKKRDKTLIGPIDLEVAKSGVTAILGPNGSGKTTLLRVIHGLERARPGYLSWNCTTQEARKKQAFVFQTPIMLRQTVIQNIAYPLKLQNIKKAERLKVSREWLEQINLSEAQNLEAHLLSGGEKQKLAIARALVTNPEILFLDEPTANLDGQSTREIETIIKDASASGVRVMITTHDIGQSKRLADDIIFLYRGQLHESGQAGAFFNTPKTKEAAAFLDGEIVE